MAIKRTRRKTGTNSYETITHNNRTAGTRRTRTVKLVGGVTRSTSISNKGKSYRSTTFTNVDGWSTRRTQSLFKQPKLPRSSKKYIRNQKMNSSSVGFILILLMISIVFSYISELLH